MIIRNTLLGTVAALSLLVGAGQVAAQAPEATVVAATEDPRGSLGGGLRDAETTSRGLELIHAIAPPPGFFDPEALFAPPQTRAEAEAYMARMRTNPPKYGPLALANTDMAMSNGRLFVGNFHGFNAYDVTRGEPRLVMSVVCPGGQGDVSVHGNLLFMSVEENRGRLDCGTKAADGAVSAERFRGVRIFDISNLNAPRQIAAVQTCRGSHTHTLVPDPKDSNVLYIYNSGTSGVRPTDELSICSAGDPGTNPETALYSIDVIKVPLNAPEQAAIVNRPRIFADRDTGAVAGLWRGGRAGVASQNTAQTNQCHDITVYPAIGMAAGACSGNGILLDISDPQNPKRVSEIFDADMAYWHSATFNAAGNKVLFTDEWGGGTSPYCKATDPANWGANMVATIDNGKLQGRSFFKIPANQGATENCVAHNGSLIPVPGRDLMIQAWYQGGLSIVDFTDPTKPVEVGYFDRGPIDASKLVIGGSWSAYWLNGRIYSSEIARGLDVLKLVPSDQLSAAEIAAAESVVEATINPQTQTRPVWADTPDVAGAYLDQLKRGNAIDATLSGQVQAYLDAWRAARPRARADKAGAATLAAALKTASEADRVTIANGGRLKALAALFERRAA